MCLELIMWQQILTTILIFLLLIQFSLHCQLMLNEINAISKFENNNFIELKAVNCLRTRPMLENYKLIVIGKMSSKQKK